MQGFADFADGLLGGMILVALSIAVGGVAWTVAVLRPWEPDSRVRLLRRTLAFVALGAGGLALAQAADLGIKALLLVDRIETSFLASFAATLQARAGAARILAATALAAAALALRARPTSRTLLALVVALAGLLTITGAWLVHAAGRLEARAILMTLTVLHELAAAVWVGGLVQVVALWAQARRDPEAAAAWPLFLARFSRAALITVAAMLAAAVPLGVLYVGSVEGLIGSGYGSLVVAKAVLTTLALALAAMNLWAVRRPAHGTERRRVPYLVEAETILVVVLLFVAASLSAQPPPADGVGERATWPELVEVFRPKWPTLSSPSVADKLVEAARPSGLGPDRSFLAYSWSNYSHNVAGVFLLGMSVVTLAGWFRPRWGRHAPLALVALAAFVFLRTSASEGTWPFGATPVLENALGNAEAFQHRIGALLALALGLVEWRARTAAAPSAWLRYLFPFLAVVGGIVLLMHSHTPFEPKSDYLIQVTHTAMGALAVLVAVGRWLELRTASRLGRAGGAASAVALLLIALVLLFYREANVVVPSGWTSLSSTWTLGYVRPIRPCVLDRLDQRPSVLPSSACSS
jgi:putative copper resistance protein D